MKKIIELFEPSNDAIDYDTKEKRERFLQTYNVTDYLSRLKESNCYYIIGEKGSGKTALALYSKLDRPNNSASELLSISATQYKKFIRLKKNKKLDYSDYASIWRTTLCMLISQQIVKNSKKWIHRITGKFRKIEEAINSYDKNSMLPEIETAIELTTGLRANAGLESPKGFKAGVEADLSEKENSAQIRFHLLETEKYLKNGLSDIKLENDFVLFIDGLDTRPTDIDKYEFHECIQGLIEAAWQLNIEYFQKLKDTSGKMRICVLIRPDIFDSLDISNSNSRVNDNSVVLRWETTTDDYKRSPIFRTLDKYFTAQNSKDENYGWNHYFPYNMPDGKNDAFYYLLNHSFIRPRDFYTAIKFLIQFYKSNRNGAMVFARNDFTRNEFSRNYSDYLLAEVKNYANYYMSNKDFSEYINYFQFLSGQKEFNYDEYETAFSKYYIYAKKSGIENTEYLENKDKFLQLLFDVNIVGYYEEPKDGSKPFFHWAYRERTLSNLSPKIKIPSNYIIFAGVMKSLDIGKNFKI